VNWADLMAAQGAFGTDFYDMSILRPKHRAYYRSGRPVIKIGHGQWAAMRDARFTPLQASDRVYSYRESDLTFLSKFFMLNSTTNQWEIPFGRIFKI